MSLAYVNDGQIVLAPVKKGQPKLRCVVACAMGNAARVVNEMHNINIWCDLSELDADTEETS